MTVLRRFAPVVALALLAVLAALAPARADEPEPGAARPAAPAATAGNETGAPVAAPPIAAPAPLADATQTQLESDLTCQCGCGLTVHSCNHLNCSSGIPLKREIAEQLAMGKSREEVLAYFGTKYGEKILSAPTTRGFNIAAWITPFVAIGLGGLLIAVVLGRWRRASAGRRTAREAAEGAAGGAPADPHLRARLDRALDEYDRRT